MTGRLLIYGASGYTGRLAVERAMQVDLDIIVAGRDAGKTALLGEEFGVESRAFALDDPDAVRAGLKDVDCVLHAAGPFQVTAQPMMQACLDAGVHYIDTTAEYPTFALAESMDEAAKRAGVMVLSGGGWQSVPSDCLVMHTARRVTDPQRLAIGLHVTGGFSRGSIAGSSIILDLGVLVRQGGKVLGVDSPQPRTFDFGDGPVDCMPAAMGELVTSWRSAGIGDIECYLGTDAGFPDEIVGGGPTAQERAAHRYQVVAEVTGRDGQVARSMIDTPNGYTYTPMAGIEIARRVLDGHAPAGYQTPASAYGIDLALAIGDTTITDL
ncbi:saccharopine dehydrogenase family protein [Streptomyces olivaceus]|uniref:saccharopine dehydrogenase family protein n=1 Tax=Streptomyces olivaceus TaxID=47716 RepID=UPI0022EFB6B7|nr:saccharopine dehydrogenase NADP-binding domain-containing protein [Streptomyces olivaceus]GHI99346.1 membrane protein [Streptomyces olivaceus]